MSLATLQVVPLDAEASGSDALPQRRNRRAHLAPELLRAHKLAAGDWLLVRSRLGGEATPKPLGWIVAQIWPRVGLEEDSIGLSPSQIANLGEGDVEVYRFPTASSKGVLKLVTVKEVESKNKASADESGVKREAGWRRAAVKEALNSVKYVAPGYKVTVGDGSSVFVVTDIQVSTKAAPPSADGVAKDLGALSLKDFGPVYEVEWRSKVAFEDEAGDDKAGDKGVTASGFKSTATTAAIPSYINIFAPSESASSSYNQLGGLGPQIKQVKALLDLPLNNPELFSRFGLTPPRGLLLHGPPGTGKTALARAIASSTPGCSCIVVNGPELSSAFHGETEERIRGVFEEARKRSPCIIVLDEVDALVPRRDGGEGGEVERRVVAMLLTLMDGMGSSSANERVIVIAATNRPNSIDPALRRPGRFDREIEIGIPDAVGRRHILDIMLAKMPHSLTPEEVDAIAARTHGYVGADLGSLVRESASAAIQRWYDNPAGADAPLLTYADVLHTLPTIRPSAMREVFVETPAVRWTDIAGQNEVKQKLRECVEWPLTHRDTFDRLGVEAPRGVLLYGPPGCSKTLTAKALATESGINFIAVKGPELLNKYVGESERAVREIFRKARAASPSIVFFDEIDALGSARDGGEGGHGGVLTSLLNEMDGIEQLSGVTVVAATNRPDVLDAALTRPGRLDRILYVGAPDRETRKEIFRIRFASMAVEPGVDVDELGRITEGCSGAEVASICQDAALATMNENLEAPYVTREHLLHSARTVRRRITPDMIRFFERWRDQSGIRISLLHDMHLEAQRVAVQADGGAVRLADVQRDERGVVVRHHGVLRLAHELVGETEAAVWPQDRDGRDVARGLVGGLFLPAAASARSSSTHAHAHLGKDVPHDPAARVDSDIRQLGPSERVVEVWLTTALTVLEGVVLRQVEQVGILHAEEVLDLASAHSRANKLTVACLMSIVGFCCCGGYLEATRPTLLARPTSTLGSTSRRDKSLHVSFAA
ncbi:AAA family ATPase AFG2 [Vanrija pseudolonga]|uniref:ATPase family gene 2 protein n=1 Tax=Vanrija pseudolonga TaxID=143232 RepID=A0AAF0YCZ2_9TREE|nr:ATPase family gene 2 protein [Vanrija pseudolonga]